jgi:hypothetical protein
VSAADYAIVVGISRYADATFPALQGPPNDVALFTAWLQSAEGGDLPAANIVTILSPPQIDPTDDPDSVPPVTEDFKRAFKRLVRDGAGRFQCRPGRLYLYLSGHGFCERKSLTAQAALYAANATREFPENIFGTYYAQLARDKALFREIILVMDCCRDAELNRSPDVPAVNESGSAAAADAKLLCLYAAPKAGKAQECQVPERGGAHYGLLTHALVKALAEAQPDAGCDITGASLKRHLLGTWDAVCRACGAEPPPPPPEVMLPSGEDIRLRCGNRGIEQGFIVDDLPATGADLEVHDSRRHTVARCSLRHPPAPSILTQGDAADAPLTFDGRIFSLTLPADFYRYVLSGGLNRSGLFACETNGGSDVRL